MIVKILETVVVIISDKPTIKVGFWQKASTKTDLLN